MWVSVAHSSTGLDGLCVMCVGGCVWSVVGFGVVGMRRLQPATVGSCPAVGRAVLLVQLAFPCSETVTLWCACHGTVVLVVGLWCLRCAAQDTSGSCLVPAFVSCCGGA